MMKHLIKIRSKIEKNLSPLGFHTLLEEPTLATQYKEIRKRTTENMAFKDYINLP